MTGSEYPLRVLSLFAGIGGIDLGMEWAGMRVVAHAEIDDYASSVLAQRWPGVPNLGDVTTIDWEPWIGKVDVIAGGFPCQDLSYAGKRAGMKEGTRSGLWAEFFRAISELRPRYVIVENVPGLLTLGGTRVTADLASAGYVGRVFPLAAADVGAPHWRKRVFIVAHTDSIEHESGGTAFRWASPAQFLTDAAAMHGPAVVWDEPHGDNAWPRNVADPESIGRRSRGTRGTAAQSEVGDTSRAALAHPDSAGRTQQWGGLTDDEEHTPIERDGWWGAEPDVGRVAHGVPKRVDRLRCLGNAVVPQCAYVIGRIVCDLESQRSGVAA